VNAQPVRGLLDGQHVSLRKLSVQILDGRLLGAGSDEIVCEAS
jgi:hypothetical protein